MIDDKNTKQAGFSVLLAGIDGRPVQEAHNTVLPWGSWTELLERQHRLGIITFFVATLSGHTAKYTMGFCSGSEEQKLSHAWKAWHS